MGAYISVEMWYTLLCACDKYLDHIHHDLKQGIFILKCTQKINQMWKADNSTFHPANKLNAKDWATREPMKRRRRRRWSGEKMCEHLKTKTKLITVERVANKKKRIVYKTNKMNTMNLSCEKFPSHGFSFISSFSHSLSRSYCVYVPVDYLSFWCASRIVCARQHVPWNDHLSDCAINSGSFLNYK